MFAYGKSLVLSIVCLCLVWGSALSPALAQDGPVPDGVAPAPVTDGSLTLDSEGGNGSNMLSSDIPEIYEDSSASRSSGDFSSNTAFLLVVMLALFGLYLYNNQSLLARINRLEAALRGGAGRVRERDELVPFSWNSVLKSIEGGFAVMPGLNLPKPCLFLVGIENEDNQDRFSFAEQERVLVANMVHTVVQDPELMVLAVLRQVGSTDIGSQLLAFLGDRPWQELDEAERQHLLRQQGKRLDHMEKTLYCLNDLVLTPTQLYQTCQELLNAGELGLVLLDSFEVLVPDEHLSESNDNEAEWRGELCEALRLLAVRCHVPVCVVTEYGSVTWRELQQRQIPGAVARMTFGEDSVRARFTLDDGAEAEKVWKYKANTGEMLV